MSAAYTLDDLDIWQIKEAPERTTGGDANG